MQKVLVPLVAVLCLGFLGFVFYLFTQDEKKTNPQVQALQKVPNRPQAAPVLPGPKVGEPAPATKAEDVDGKEFALADYRGKVVVLDFWGFW